MDHDFLFDVWHLFVRALKKTIRTPIVIISALALPVLFLVLFTQIFTQFGNLPGFPAGGYVQFAVAGVIIMNPLMDSGGAGEAVVDDINSGFLSKMLVTPANRTAIVLGRLLHDMVMVLLPVGITLVLAYAPWCNRHNRGPGNSADFSHCRFLWVGYVRADDGNRSENKEFASSRRVRSCDCIPSYVCEHGARAIRVPSALGASLFERQPVQLRRQRGQGTDVHRICLEHHSGRVCSYSGVRRSDDRSNVVSVQDCGEVGD